MSRILRRVTDRVQDMLEAIRNARSDIGNLGKQEFLSILVAFLDQADRSADGAPVQGEL